MSDPDLRDLAARGYRFARSLAGDRAAAEDLVQEAWTAVLAAEGRMDRGYLFRAIRSRWIDGHRRSQVVQFEELSQPVIDRRTDPRNIDRGALERALGTLRIEEREVLFLHVVEGYTTAEVGEFLGRPKNTVLSQLSRGRARLQAWYAAREEEAM